MKKIVFFVLLSICSTSFADQADVKTLLKDNTLSDYICTYETIIYIARYEDEAYMGPTEKIKSGSMALLSVDAVEAVKQVLLIGKIKKTDAQNIDPLSISCRKK